MYVCMVVSGMVMSDGARKGVIDAFEFGLDRNTGNGAVAIRRHLNEEHALGLHATGSKHACSKLAVRYNLHKGENGKRDWAL